MSSISANLGDMARELVDAQDRSDKLTKKGAKASTLKVDEAVAKLESSQQQWDSTAPFVFETLQALDESRVNQLRDLLTQYHTLESAHAQRIIKTSEIALVLTSNINTQEEIESFQTKTIASRPKLPPTQSSSRQQSFAPPSPPPAPASFTEASFKPQPARTGAETGLTSQRTQTPPTSQQTADEDSEQLSQLPEPKQGESTTFKANGRNEGEGGSKSKGEMLIICRETPTTRNDVWWPPTTKHVRRAGGFTAEEASINFRPTGQQSWSHWCLASTVLQ